MPDRTWPMSRLQPVHGDPTGGKWRNTYSTLTLMPPSNILPGLTKGQTQLADRGLGSAMVYVCKSVSLGMHVGEGSGSGGVPGRSSSVTIHMW